MKVQRASCHSDKDRQTSHSAHSQPIFNRQSLLSVEVSRIVLLDSLQRSNMATSLELSNVTQKKHILCFAFPAYGHTIPLLELCRKLSRYHHVTFAVSKFNAERMRDREFKALAAEEPVALLPIDDGMPADSQIKVEDWEAEHERSVKYILPGVVSLMRDVAQLNQGKDIPGLTRPVDVIIFDMFLTAPVMDNRIPAVLFYYLNTPPAYFIRFLLMLKDVTGRCPIEEQDFFQELPPPGETLPAQSEMLMSEMGNLGKYLPKVDGVICNSYRAIDNEEMAALAKEEQMNGVKFFCLGPFMPPTTTSAGSELDVAMLHWLDKQKPHSVVYISFGSMAVPTEPQLQEIARALLNLGIAFIWSLRKGHEEKLPEAIREAITKPMDDENRHFWVVPWVPQKAVLNHPSTGVYLSHCGWNSALESMTAGVPVLSWPLFADQRYIGRFLVKRGAALMIQGTDLFFKRLVPTEEIQKALGTLLIEHAYRDNMEDIKHEIADALSENGSSIRELEEFVQFNV